MKVLNCIWCEAAAIDEIQPADIDEIATGCSPALAPASALEVPGAQSSWPVLQAGGQAPSPCLQTWRLGLSSTGLLLLPPLPVRGGGSGEPLREMHIPKPIESLPLDRVYLSQETG